MTRLVSLQALIILSGCSVKQSAPEFPEDRVTFETHMLLGQIRYVKGECQLVTPIGMYNKVRFRLPVRRIVTPSSSPISVSVADDGDLQVIPLVGADAEDILLKVTLYDGRTFPLRIRAEGAAADARASLNLAKVLSNPAMPATETKEAIAFLAKVVDIHKHKRTSSEAEVNDDMFDKLALDTPKLRATYAKTYIGKVFVAHVLEVSNRMDIPQEIHNDEFKFPGLRTVHIENAKLFARWDDKTGQNRTLVYIVVKP